MSTVARYTFSSWLRRGISTKISQPDNLGSGAPSVSERATVSIGVKLNGTDVPKDFSLIGPGDIIGVIPTMIVRTEPRREIANFEPNYLAFMEFYDEDFAWRYTPAGANDRKLRPWFALAVLKKGEFKRDDRSQPLSSIMLASSGTLPPPGELWAWGHVHINEGHASTTAFEAFLKTLHDLDNPNADKIICRLFSPRRLEPNTSYGAFLVPSFETGRLAGLGQDPAGVDAQKPAWTAGGGPVQLPVYFEWEFSTGEAEDFESLVKLLVPRTMDERVGIRDMDGSKPGFGLAQPTDLGDIPAVPPAPAPPPSIVGLEGALMAPSAKPRPPALDLDRPFFPALQKILNLPVERRKTSNDPETVDPVVVPPLYGENHAMVHELDFTNGGWLHALNRDPRNRVPGGFGTRVIQRNQEAYVARAWTQVRRILEANRKILFAAFSMHVANRAFEAFALKLDTAKTLIYFSPLLKKVKGSPTTLHRQMADSLVPPAAVSPALRRLMRPRGPYARRAFAADGKFSLAQLVSDLNDGKVSAAPPKKVPEGLFTDRVLAGGLAGSRVPAWLRWLAKRRWLLLLVLLLLAIVLFFIAGPIVAGVVAAAALGAFAALTRVENQADIAAAVASPAGAVDLAASAPARPGFALTETDSAVPETAAPGTNSATRTETSSASPNAASFTVQTYRTATSSGDSLEARNFRSAAGALGRRLQLEAPEKRLLPFDMVNARDKLRRAVDPRRVFPSQLVSEVNLTFNPEWLLAPENLVPAMAYPDFEDPMYAKLRDISSALLLPNIDLIPPNTISLLKTNPPFIESYMVGLNHEFGRELLWREYPTDTRCSSFRQFWDVRGIITNQANASPEKLVDQWKDITPIDTWPQATTLGTHNRQHGKVNMVLVIRGELLKKYDRVIIYAQRAHIYKNPKTGKPDPAHMPVIREVQSEADMASEIKFPQFHGEVDPDIKFFGFDLTEEQARGAAQPQLESDDWGYYFILQEIPGEPRFGMDLSYSPDNTTPIGWDDLAWDKYPADRRFIECAVRPQGFTPATSGENLSQWGSDSASMAYIFYQKPVMIAVHARDMLDGVDQP